MGKDKRGVLCGKCLKCEECDECETTGTDSILFEYCGHRPVKHEVITHKEEPRLEPIQEELEIDLSCDGQGLVESIVNKPGSVSTSVSLNLGDVFPAENTSARPSPPHGIPEERIEVVGVVDVDNKLKSQQLKANELAKEESGVAFNIKRRQGKLFPECNVCSSEVTVGQANHDLSLLKLHITTSKHKLNTAINRSRSSEILKEIQRNSDSSQISQSFSLSRGGGFVPFLQYIICYL